MKDRSISDYGPVKLAPHFTGLGLRIFNLTKRGATGIDKGVAQGFVAFLLSTDFIELA